MGKNDFYDMGGNKLKPTKKLIAQRDKDYQSNQKLKPGTDSPRMSRPEGYSKRHPRKEQIKKEYPGVG